MKSLMMLAVAALSMAAAAQGPREMRSPRGPMGMGMGGMRPDPVVQLAMNPKMAEKIGITAEQQKKFKEIDDTQRKAMRELSDKARAAQKEQMGLLKAEKVDEAAVMASIDKVFDVRKEMAKLQTRRIIAVKALLTPEQLAKAAEEMKARAARRTNRRSLNAKPGEAKPGEAKSPEAKPAEKAPAAAK